MRVRDFSMVAALAVALIAGSAYAGQSSAGAPQTSRAAMAAPPLTAVTPPQAPATKLREPDVIYVPTPQNVVDAMLKMANVTAKDVVYDLGSGDGRIPITAAEKYGARGVGIEIDPRLVEIARQVARDGEIVAKVTFIEDDLFTADISEATVVTLALSPAVNVKLEARLRRDLRPGTRIVSHEFPIGDWVPDARVRALDGTTLYLFTVPQR